MSTNGNSLNGRGMYIWEEITPDIAAEWLAHNAVNRNVRRAAVAQYAADMAAGNWREADAPITRRADGMLLDGQHRLSAIIASGKTIGAWVHIVSDNVAPMDLRIDVGKVRTITDIAGLGTRHAGAARTLISIAGNGNNVASSIDTVLKVAEAIAPQFDMLTTTTRRGISTAGVAAATCYSMFAYPSDAEVIAAQYDALVASQIGYPFWPAVESAARQVMDDPPGSWRSRSLAFMRFARAFSAQSRGLSRVQFKDLNVALREIAPKVSAYIGRA